jgi:hypothetical protein
MMRHYNRGNALSALRRHDEALLSYDRAPAIRPAALQGCARLRAA